LSQASIKPCRDGRRRYDPAAKRALVEACLQPGASVAGLALANGVNANLLRKWIMQYRQAQDGGEIVKNAGAFVPVVAANGPIAQNTLRLQATFPNGIVLDISDVSPEALSSLLPILSELPCSASTPT